VLYLDTNVFVPGQGDTLLIERLDATGAVVERRRHTAPNKSDWPVSFGVLPGSRAARFRVRLYPESRIATRKRDDTSFVSAPGVPDARTDYDRDASYGVVDVGDPLPGFAIDRLIEIAPAKSFERVRVTLKGECMGVVADVATNRSCDGGPEPVAANVVERIDRPPSESQVGTWRDAIEKPCSGTPRAESGAFDEDVCIPGGVFFLGDERMATARCAPLCDTSPERVVRLSPFYLDKYEVSVGRFRLARKASFKPTTGSVSTGSLCTYRDDGTADALPMNCVTWLAAKEFCEFDGRTLVTEAQWEYAASGRGRENLYVWGDDLPSCERAAYARVGEKINPAYSGAPTPGSFTECKLLSQGPSKVGSFVAQGQDVTVDGVTDLNANLREWVLDEIETYDRGCWGTPLLIDPVCKGLYPGLHVQRGASWGGGTGQLGLAWRDGRTDEDARTMLVFLGFRCARAAR
jgi:formylglycine-generating enzyme required for sulfatase activity